MSQSFTSAAAADWSNNFQQTSSIFADPQFSEATIMSTSMMTPVADPSQSKLGSSSSGPSRGGRVTKPARKRSRASRRTPTTLLETDTSNFRAMVQKFTGGPSVLGFGAGALGISHPQPRRVTDQLRGSASNPSLSIPPGDSLQFQQQQQQQQLVYGGGGLVVEPSRMTGTMTSSVNVKGNTSNRGFMY